MQLLSVDGDGNVESSEVEMPREPNESLYPPAQRLPTSLFKTRTPNKSSKVQKRENHLVFGSLRIFEDQHGSTFARQKFTKKKNHQFFRIRRMEGAMR